MAIRQKVPEFRSWTENVAVSIGDPVRRLRFLRAVAPIRAERRRGWRRIGAIVLLPAAVLAAIVLFFAHAAARVPPPPAAPAAPRVATPAPAARHEVWQVEDRAGSEVYSNGLRIESGSAVSNHPRSYLAFPVSGEGAPIRRSQPAGIVFHSTESQQAPFEAGHNEALKRIGESLLDYVRRRRSYHFLVDRFGRIYRVVQESDAADHAGYSVWADDQSVYLNLNESFLGIAFEASTRSGPGEPTLTAAQIRSALMLTEMLRARYRIPAANCVTHAQVSVNPSNMRAGYHVDWGAGFPFQEVGLPDNNAAALPSVWVFGFECDPAFRSAAGPALQAGAQAAERLLNERAGSLSLRPAAYRKRLQQEFRQKLAAMGRTVARLNPRR